MKKPDDSQISKQLIEELQRLYSSGQMHQETESDQEAHKVEKHQKISAMIGKLDPAIVAELEALMHKLRDANVPFLISFVLAKDEVKKDAEGNVEQRIVLSNYSWSPVQICEFLAAQCALSLPHEFSHQVIEMAGSIVAFKTILEELFKKLQDEDDEDQ